MDARAETKDMPTGSHVVTTGSESLCARALWRDGTRSTVAIRPWGAGREHESMSRARKKAGSRFIRHLVESMREARQGVKNTVAS